MNTHDIDLPDLPEHFDVFTDRTHSEIRAYALAAIEADRKHFAELFMDLNRYANGMYEQEHDPYMEGVADGYGYAAEFLLGNRNAAEEIEADRKRIAATIESSWREGWAACRDAEYVGSEAEDSAYGSSRANLTALRIEQGEPLQEADRQCRCEPVGHFQNVNALIPDADPLYEQVTGEHAGDPDVFPLYAAPQPAEQEQKPSVEALEGLVALKHQGYQPIQIGPLPPPPAPRPAEPHTSDYQQGHEAGWQDCRELYEPVLEDHRRLVRELDVLLNGEGGAAEQASLCDIVAQVRREGIKAAEPVKVPGDAEILEIVGQVMGTDRASAAIATKHSAAWVRFARALLARYGKEQK